jgi:transcriptional regulator with XRE-family HTH domain
MTICLDISSGVAKKPDVPRFPPAYGKYLERLALSVGLRPKDIATKLGVEDNTVYRNLGGRPERSDKMAKRIRQLLVERYGLAVEDVPSDQDWVDPINRPISAGAPKLNGTAEIFRRNLVRFREDAGFHDLHAVSTATHISVEDLRAYEDGRATVPGLQLLELARIYDRRPEHFEMDLPPPRDRRPPPAVHARVVGDLNDMAPENRARVLELQRELAAINEEERRRLEQAATALKPKRR